MGNSTEHAVLSPSGASRWLACTPSARLEQQFPDKSGAAAAEGTLAHALGELLIRYRLQMISKPVYLKNLKEIEENQYYEHAMFEHMDNYAVFVMEKFTEAQSHTKDAKIFLEQKLNLTEYVPDGFGTGDVIIIANSTLILIDLKYGKGVPVSALENKQMMLYGLGGLRDYSFVYDIHKVGMIIYQPRLDSVTEYFISVDELTKWADIDLKPRAHLAFEGQGDFVPGQHCRFCKAKAVCKANAEFNLQLAKHDFKQAALLEDEDIADILSRADTFIKWLSSVSEHALFEAVNNGKKWPGYKLVEGRSNRTYADEAKIVEKLKAEGLPEDKIYNKKLVGITDMEKELGKKEFAELLGPFIVKPAGKPTLTPVADKRAEYNSIEGAKVDFADVADV